MSGFSGFGETAFGDTGSSTNIVVADAGSAAGAADVGPLTVAELIPGLLGAAIAGDDINDRLQALLAEAIVAGDGHVAELLPNLIERVNLTGTVLHSALLAGNVADTGRFDDAVMAAWMLLLAENLQTAGTAAGNIRYVLGVIDTIAAIGLADTQLTANAAVVSALTAEAMIGLGFAPDALSTSVLQDTAASIARMFAPLLDTASGTDSHVPLLRLTAISADAMHGSDDPSALLRAAVDLADNVLFYGVFSIGGTEYRGWVMNAPLQAVSEHTHGAWDSFASFKGKHYAAGESGIVQFTGNSATDTAAGAQVDAFVRTAMLDFGTSSFKRVPDVFVGVDTDGRMFMKVRTRDREAGAYTEDWYAVTRTKDGPGTGRAELGRGLRSTWWQFELHNIDGAGFDLDRIEMRPLKLDKRT